jgi:hypothetical protein
MQSSGRSVVRGVCRDNLAQKVTFNRVGDGETRAMWIHLESAKWDTSTYNGSNGNMSGLLKEQ